VSAFGYVVGLACDEWGYVSVSELLETKVAKVFPIMSDTTFVPLVASALGIER
jgi:hypothetical protein